MKVKELIQKLNKLNPELEVLIYDTEGHGPASITNVSVIDYPEDWPKDWNMPDEWVSIAG